MAKVVVEEGGVVVVVVKEEGASLIQHALPHTKGVDAPSLMTPVSLKK